MLGLGPNIEKKEVPLGKTSLLGPKAALVGAGYYSASVGDCHMPSNSSLTRIYQLLYHRELGVVEQSKYRVSASAQRAFECRSHEDLWENVRISGTSSKFYIGFPANTEWATNLEASHH